MRYYQLMVVARKLTDEILESILWNKVPLELHKELGEIPNGSVQELLQRLLHAEMVIQERARRSGNGEKFPKKERQRVKLSLVSLTRSLKIRVIPVFHQSLRTSLKCP